MNNFQNFQDWYKGDLLLRFDSSTWEVKLTLIRLLLANKIGRNINSKGVRFSLLDQKTFFLFFTKGKTMNASTKKSTKTALNSSIQNSIEDQKLALKNAAIKKIEAKRTRSENAPKSKTVSKEAFENIKVKQDEAKAEKARLKEEKEQAEEIARINRENAKAAKALEKAQRKAEKEKENSIKDKQYTLNQIAILDEKIERTTLSIQNREKIIERNTTEIQEKEDSYMLAQSNAEDYINNLKAPKKQKTIDNTKIMKDIQTLENKIAELTKKLEAKKALLENNSNETLFETSNEDKINALIETRQKFLQSLASGINSRKNYLLGLVERHNSEISKLDNLLKEKSKFSSKETEITLDEELSILSK